MKFIVEKEIFEKLPNACFGVAAAVGMDNSRNYPEIDALLEESIRTAAARFEGVLHRSPVYPHRQGQGHAPHQPGGRSGKRHLPQVHPSPGRP